MSPNKDESFHPLSPNTDQKNNTANIITNIPMLHASKVETVFAMWRRHAPICMFLNSISVVL